MTIQIPQKTYDDSYTASIFDFSLCLQTCLRTLHVLSANYPIVPLSNL